MLFSAKANIDFQSCATKAEMYSIVYILLFCQEKCYGGIKIAVAKMLGVFLAKIYMSNSKCESAIRRCILRMLRPRC